MKKIGDYLLNNEQTLFDFLEENIEFLTKKKYELYKKYLMQDGQNEPDDKILKDFMNKILDDIADQIDDFVDSTCCNVPASTNNNDTEPTQANGLDRPDLFPIEEDLSAITIRHPNLDEYIPPDTVDVQHKAE